MTTRLLLIEPLSHIPLIAEIIHEIQIVSKALTRKQRIIIEIARIDKYALLPMSSNI